MASLTDGTAVQTTGGGSGGLTDAQLRATPVSVSVGAPVALDATTLAALENVGVTGTVVVSGTVPVSGTFWQATQPVSGTVAVSGTVPVSGPLTDAQLRASAVPVSLALLPPESTATLAVTVTAAAAAAATLTLPAAGSGLFHYITHLQIVKYNSAAVTGTATPILVTSTNLPGALVWTFQRFGAIGQIGPADIQPTAEFTRPLRSAVANTATTIVCPATTGVLWRVNVHYYTA